MELMPEMWNKTQSHGYILIKFLNMGGTTEFKLFARNLKRRLTIKIILKILKKEQASCQYHH
jgi:hypothetical protein